MSAVRAFAVLVVTLAVCVCGGASASAAEPWWHLSMGARPTVLPVLHAPATGVQEVTATTGIFISTPTLVAGVEVEGQTIGCAAAGEYASALCAVEVAGKPVLETDAQWQAALEGVYGSGGVQVSGDLLGSPALRVATPGRDVPPIKLHAIIGTAQATTVAEGGSGGRLLVVAFNLGDAATSGPVTLTDVLPRGLTATRVAGTALGTGLPEEEPDERVSCTVVGVKCTFEGVLAPYERLEMVVWVLPSGLASSGGEENEASVSGGGAREVSRADPVAFGEGPVAFGVEPGSYELEPEAEGGMPDAQTGSHPYQLTTTLRMNETGQYPFQPAQPRNLQFYLPAGLVGDAQATPQCTYAEFSTMVFYEATKGRNGRYVSDCPVSTAVGVSMQTFDSRAEVVPVFNLTPVRGEPARFGFEINRVPIILNTSVRTGSDYGVTVSVRNLTQATANVLSSVVSIWGDPGSASHNLSRGWGCLVGGENPGCAGTPESNLPLLTLPTACQAFQAPMQAQSWRPGAELLPRVASRFEEQLDSCNQLPFAAGIEAAPDVQSASAPSGLKVDVHVPQEAALNPEGLTNADVRTIKVTLPQGVRLNPGGANGLEACSESEIGFQGAESGEPARELFTPVLGEPFCPDGSKLGTVKITTPLLPNPLEGSVYLASPASDGEEDQNPFNGLVALYIVAEDPVSGTIVKLPGKVVPDPATGQLTATFEDSPQLPFEDAELHFFGGENAPLATPPLCGSYTTHATFEPWSGGTPVEATSTFHISSGAHDGPCPSDPLPFSPEFQAGMTNLQAGGFSELQTTMGHPDPDQALGGIQIKLPPGLSGVLSSVKLCEEPQAAQGTCGSESLIGHTIVTAGLGSSPTVVKRPGSVYITGPYDGAPFGLSIANPAEAGPFDLEKGTPCDCVVVRAKIEVNPQTAALTITSDPLPTMIKGIPLDLQHVQVAIAKEVNGGHFAFNPTSCEPMSIEATITGSENASAPVATPFHVTNCGALMFEPKFSVSTQGKTSRADGASLIVHLSEPSNSLGNDTNIKQVKVELPGQLPSRLTTLQKACAAAQFHANPAGCPAASIVGHAVVHTPLLAVPLEGPAYFVSNGGEAFPNLILVLQGDNVKVELVGDTFISEAGITSSTFKTVPDVPFSTFELTLPEEANSALAANANLCARTKTVTVKQKITVRTKNAGHKTITREVKKTETVPLRMPVEFQAQDAGNPLHQSIPVTVTGCTKAKTKTKIKTKVKTHKKANEHKHGKKSKKK